MAATLQSIADELGISVPTVSEILSASSKGQRYRQETRDKVVETARRLGYRPNASARAVSTGRHGCVSFLTSMNPGLADFPSELIRGLQAPMAHRGLRLVMSSLPDEKLTSEAFMGEMRDRLGVDGLLVNYLANVPPPLEHLIEEFKIPATWINYKRPTNSVHFDDFGAARAATERLISLGHRKIVFLNYASGSETNPVYLHYSMVDRHAGYAEAMRAAGLAPRTPQGLKLLSPIEAAAFTRSWLGDVDRPTAALTYSPHEARMAILIATELGIRIPEEFSLITFDYKLYCEMGIPVTTMSLPIRQLGERAAEKLLDILESHEAGAPSETLAVTPLEGSSCAVPPQPQKPSQPRRTPPPEDAT